MVQTATPRARDRRLEILRAAAEVFRRKGYAAAGMREIAEALSLAPGALYYYFESKEDLLFACQEESLRLLLGRGRRIAAGAGPARERLRALVRMHLETTLDHLGGSAAHVEFSALPPERLKAVIRRRDAYERVVRRVVEDGIRDRSFRPVDVKMTVLALLGALNWAVVWWRPGGAWKPENVEAGFLDVFLGGLEAPPAREAAR
jgi:TetR/AcrR family transcriptional regulator